MTMTTTEKKYVYADISDIVDALEVVTKKITIRTLRL